VATAPAASAANDCGTFTDVSARDKTYYAPVTWMSCQGITTGYPNGSFGVKRPVTRGEVAVFLYRQVTPSFQKNGRNYFTDVPGQGRFHSDAITWMAQAGIAKGNSDGTFRPDAPVTRGEMAAFLYRLAGATAKGPNYSPFDDMRWSTNFYHEASWLKARGIAKGNADKTYRPKRNITRGETAIMLKNANKIIAHRGDVTTPAVSPLPSRTDGSPASGSALASKAVQWATATANNPKAYYAWGGNGPLGFDCSGFTAKAFSVAGKSLPRTAASQYGAATDYVPVSQAKPGDLVYWSNNGSGSGTYHIAVVIGGGKIAHARNPTMGVAITDIDYSPWNMLGVAGRYR
jgi:cell wall-associated NlpC family hydrolase